MLQRTAEFIPLIAEQEPIGLAAWRGVSLSMRSSHTHADVEINLIVNGEVEYFLGGRFEKIEEKSVAVFWGGIPHILAHKSPGTEMIWVVVPLTWFLQWQLPNSLNDDLLQGKMLRAPASEVDEAILGRWCEELPSSGRATPRARPEIKEIVTLELEAYLRRFAIQQQKPSRKKTHPSHVNGAGTNTQIEKLTAFMGAHYREEIAVADIASSANLHPHYAMQLFRQKCGMSLWEYVIRLRISHAQYLLLTTDRKVEDLATASGFASPARFYAAFSRYAGVAPRKWREEQRARE